MHIAYSGNRAKAFSLESRGFRACHLFLGYREMESRRVLTSFCIAREGACHIVTWVGPLNGSIHCLRTVIASKKHVSLNTTRGPSISCL